jgi:hypothetical protein
MIKYLFSLLIFVLAVSDNCYPQAIANAPADKSLNDSLRMLPDETRVGDIVIHNLFKNQILAHADGIFDSLLVVNKVYHPHQRLWDNCYAMIFGEENAKKFNTNSGMIVWNKSIYPKNKTKFDNLTRQLLAMNVDSVLNANLKKFNRLVKYQPQAEISFLFTPIQGIGFGGCNAGEFALELNYSNTDLNYTINKGIPHELNHLAYEKRKTNDPQKGSALAQAIDEGLPVISPGCFLTDRYRRMRL